MRKVWKAISTSTITIFGIIFPLLLISLIILFTFVVNTTQEIRYLISTDFNAVHTHWDIIKLNNSLADSVQMAIMTGDKKWLARYHTDYLSLQQKLALENKVATEKNLQGDFVKISSYLQQANLLESQAIQLLEQNNPQAAKDILNTETYISLSQKIYDAMNEHNQSLANEVNQQLVQGVVYIRNAIITFIISLFLLMIIFTLAFKNMRKIKKLDKNNKQLDELLYFSRLTEMNIKPQSQAFHPFFTEMQNNRAELTHQVKNGLLNNEFKIYYQPIVNATTRKIVGAESLIRWQHPIHGLLFPDAFLPLCEATGVIADIDTFVFKSTCQQLAKWQQSRYNKLWVSINFSTSQINDPDLINMIQKAITDNNIPSSCIHIEVTESLLLNKTEATSDNLNQLRNIGIHLSLDDFGTGHSSLQYLKQFPFSTLKIDRSFITDMTTNITSMAIVEATITLGRNLGLALIAEGVENESQLHLLKNMHCHLIQGYLFSKPVPVDEFSKLLHANHLLAINSQNPLITNPSHYQFQVMQTKYYEQAVQMITKSFCDHEPMTKYLDIDYPQFLPFAELIVKKAIKDGLSIVALDGDEICACAIVEDIATPLDLSINIDTRFKVIFSLLEQLSADFFHGKNITHGHVAHLFITAVNEKYQQQGLSIKVNFEAIKLAKQKQYDFMCCEFTHSYNEENTILNLKNNRLLIKSCIYKDFIYDNKRPLENLEGMASAYIWELKDGAVLGKKSEDDKVWDH